MKEAVWEKPRLLTAFSSPPRDTASYARASPLAMEVLETLDDPRFTTELARFNLEANLPPYRLGGDCLRRLEKDLDNIISMARAAAVVNGADVMLTGILPTLQPKDLTLDNMTPRKRYFALNGRQAEGSIDLDLFRLRMDLLGQ